MSKQELLTLQQAADLINTNVEEIKRLSKSDSIEAVIEEGEAMITKRSAMEFIGEVYTPGTLSKAEVAHMLGLSEGSVYAYGKQGKIIEVDGEYDTQSVLQYKAQRDANAGKLRTAKADKIPESREDDQNNEGDLVDNSGTKESAPPSEAKSTECDPAEVKPMPRPSELYTHREVEALKEAAYYRGRCEAYESLSEYKR